MTDVLLDLQEILKVFQYRRVNETTREQMKVKVLEMFHKQKLAGLTDLPTPEFTVTWDPLDPSRISLIPINAAAKKYFGVE